MSANRTGKDCETSAKNDCENINACFVFISITIRSISTSKCWLMCRFSYLDSIGKVKIRFLLHFFMWYLNYYFGPPQRIAIGLFKIRSSCVEIVKNYALINEKKKTCKSVSCSSCSYKYAINGNHIRFGIIRSRSLWVATFAIALKNRVFIVSSK